MNLTQERLKELVNYDPNTGLFTRGNKTYSILNTKVTAQGYLRIIIDYDEYLIHRLAWFYVHGYWPERLDHSNGNKIDNRIANLRECTKAENAWNSSKRLDNTSGYKGIEWLDYIGSYRAKLTANNKQYQKCFNARRYGSKETALQKAIIWLNTNRIVLHQEFYNIG